MDRTICSLTSEASRAVQVPNQMIQHDEFIPHLKTFLIDHILPENAAMWGRIMQEAHAYMLDEDQSLLRKIGDDKMAPYIEPIFRGDFME